jgi:hypothetical protein
MIITLETCFVIVITAFLLANLFTMSRITCFGDVCATMTNAELNDRNSIHDGDRDQCLYHRVRTLVRTTLMTNSRLPTTLRTIVSERNERIIC